MTKWDYLRTFHASHPEAGEYEPMWVATFDRVYQATMRAKTPTASYGTVQADARLVAAEAAELGYRKHLEEKKESANESNLLEFG